MVVTKVIGEGLLLWHEALLCRLACHALGILLPQCVLHQDMHGA